MAPPRVPRRPRWRSPDRPRRPAPWRATAAREVNVVRVVERPAAQGPALLVHVMVESVTSALEQARAGRRCRTAGRSRCDGDHGAIPGSRRRAGRVAASLPSRRFRRRRCPMLLAPPQTDGGRIVGVCDRQRASGVTVGSARARRGWPAPRVRSEPARGPRLPGSGAGPGPSSSTTQPIRRRAKARTWLRQSPPESS